MPYSVFKKNITPVINLIVFESPVNRFSIAYLLFILEKKCDCRIFRIFYFKDAAGVNEIFKKADILAAPCIFMFSFMSSIICEVSEALDKIKKNAAEYKITDRIISIAGGAHPSGDPVSVALMGFDLIFQNEAENSWPDFLNLTLKYHTEIKFKEKLLSNYSSQIIRDERPVSLDDYLPAGNVYSLVPPLEIMRGCFFNCKFCQTASCAVKYRGFDSILEFFELYNARGYKRLCFICPSAFHYDAVSPAFLNIGAIENMLSTARHKYGIKYIEYGIFPSESRPETITDETAALIVKYCSNRRVSIGAQSGEPARVLKLARGHTIDSVYKACEILRRHRLTAVVDFIFGFPDETEEEQMKTLAVMKDLHTKFGARIQTHFFLSLPGTSLYLSKYSPIGMKPLALLEKYLSGGICTGWYKEGITQSEKVYDYLLKLYDKNERSG